MPTEAKTTVPTSEEKRGLASCPISVIIPAHNAAATIGRTLRSLAPDAGLIGEVLVMDDGSTDATASVAAEMAILYNLPLQTVSVRARSAGGARNAGLDRATGKFIYLLDADDELTAGGLSLLHQALIRDGSAGLAVGANVRRTEGRSDKLKCPTGYGGDPFENARSYLRNGMWPIAMGSALVVASRLGAIRFPEAIGLDEDTCFWAALLAREHVATVETPVLLYHHDERRMTDRFLRAPRTTLLAISREFNRLADFGIDRATLQWRKAWVALRIARQLLIGGRYTEAANMLRAAEAHAEFRHGWKVFQYRVRTRAGRLAQRFQRRLPVTAGASSPRRTLVLTYDPAWPPVSGADLRNWGNALAAAKGGPVLLVSVRPHGDSSPSPETGVAVASLELPGEKRKPSLKHRRTSIEPRIPATALKRLLDLTKEFGSDTIVVEGVPLFCLLRHLRPLANTLVFDMHNVESELAAQRNQRAPLSKRLWMLLGNNVRRIRRRERQAADLADRVWVCSDSDRERLLAMTHPKAINIVPNGIPRFEEMPTMLPPLAAKDAGWPVLLFVGHLGYWPNVEAAQRLASVILPKVRQQFPNARLLLAGRHPKDAVRELTKLAGVQVIEHPPDLSKLYRSAHLCVAPLISGGGTRIKLLEAMAWGLPVVATSVAVEGLGLADGIDVALAETDEGLAQLACELCTNPARMERQRTLAHAYARLNFGPAAIERAVRDGLKARC